MKDNTCLKYIIYLTRDKVIKIHHSGVVRNLSNDELLQSLNSHATSHDTPHRRKSWIVPVINKQYFIPTLTDMF